MPIVRAIDVGFGVTKYIRREPRTPLDRDCCAMFPSLAQFDGVDQTETDDWGQRIEVVSVPAGAHFYSVGPDVDLVLAAHRPSNPRDDYIESKQYRAYLRGALYFMNVEVVDLLVLGLPVVDLVAKKARLVRIAEGEHRVSSGRKVLVKRAMVVAQPQGALVTYAAQRNTADDWHEREHLVIDAGTRTFDWVVSRGLRLQTRQSGSAEAGVHHILRDMAMAISKDIGAIYDAIDPIDDALRARRALRIGSRTHALDKYQFQIERIVDKGICEMCDRIGDRQRFDTVVLAGGGAFLFRDRIRQVFRKHDVVELEDPIYANVRGFQLAGQDQLAAETHAARATAEVGS